MRSLNILGLVLCVFTSTSSLFAVGEPPTVNDQILQSLFDSLPEKKSFYDFVGIDEKSNPTLVRIQFHVTAEDPTHPKSATVELQNVTDGKAVQFVLTRSTTDSSILSHKIDRPALKFDGKEIDSGGTTTISVNQKRKVRFGLWNRKQRQVLEISISSGGIDIGIKQAKIPLLPSSSIRCVVDLRDIGAKAKRQTFDHRNDGFSADAFLHQ